MSLQSQEQQQKDFLDSLFPSDNHIDSNIHPDGSVQQSAMPMFNHQYTPNAPARPPASMGMSPTFSQNFHPQLNMDLLGNLMHMQNIDTTAPPLAMVAAAATSSPYNPQLLLEQQFKLTQLQQLQHLQNQIFQQQIALISSQAAGLMPDTSALETRERAVPYHGLPTPGSSTELRAQQHPIEYVSPMILSNYNDPDPQHSYRNTLDTLSPALSHSGNSHHFSPPHRGSTSAPEHIAFRTSPSLFPPTSPDLDFDISPLTSPWLGAHQQSHHHQSGSSNNKRNASSSGDEGNPRKRPSPAIRATNPQAMKKLPRATKSTNSTPLLRSSRSRKGSIAEVIGDTPSPVDLSMPPPAPPGNAAASTTMVQITTTPTVPSSVGVSSAFHYSLPPQTPEIATPASIMNLGRLGTDSSLAPLTRQQPLPVRDESKGKGTAKLKPASTAVNNSSSDTPGRGTKSGKKTGGGSLGGHNLKVILPAGLAGNQPYPTGAPSTSTTSASASTSTTATATASAPATTGSGGGGTSTTSAVPVVQVRKTSHKAAEQKRRDSLKTTFDDLRVLLPPIPLPTEDKTDEPIRPGALPPRGPPKAGVEGPNKAVSKLQLLMCGNEFIRQLKGRVERRDEEIGRLRREVVRLRGIMGPGAECGAEVGLDLERDLDAVEALSLAFGRGSINVDEADEADEEGDE